MTLTVYECPQCKGKKPGGRVASEVAIIGAWCGTCRDSKKRAVRLVVKS